jgi:hypothetical protein
MPDWPRPQSPSIARVWDGYQPSSSLLSPSKQSNMTFQTRRRPGDQQHLAVQAPGCCLADAPDQKVVSVEGQVRTVVLNRAHRQHHYRLLLGDFAQFRPSVVLVKVCLPLHVQRRSKSLMIALRRLSSPSLQSSVGQSVSLQFPGGSAGKVAGEIETDECDD